jgi:hypothetical protein
MARDAQADGRADHPDLISVPRITIEFDPYADRRRFRFVGLMPDNDCGT